MRESAVSNPVKFYVGLDDLPMAKRFDRSFISVKRLVKRKSDFIANNWIMDSGAFSDIEKHGRFLLSVGEYAEQIDRWRIQNITQDCADCIGQTVRVVASLNLDPEQKMVVECAANAKIRKEP